MWDFVAADRPGVTVTTLTTPVGKLSVRHEVLPEMVAMGVEPYLREHLIKDEADYRTVESILERAEFVPQYEKIGRRGRRVGENGYVVPLLHRIPFQQVLLEYLGEVACFYALCMTTARASNGFCNCSTSRCSRSLDELGRVCRHSYVEFPGQPARRA